MALFVPTTVQIAHELDNHEHVVCTSIDQQHIHEMDAHCDEFFKHLTTFSYDFASYKDVIPTQFYTTLFIDKPQLIKEVYHSKKTSRGPPFFTL